MCLSLLLLLYLHTRTLTHYARSAHLCHARSRVHTRAQIPRAHTAHGRVPPAGAPPPTLPTSPPPYQAKKVAEETEWQRPAAHSGTLKTKGKPAALRKRSDRHLANITKRGLESVKEGKKVRERERAFRERICACVREERARRAARH